MYAAGLSYALGSDFYYGTNKVLLDDIARNPVLLLYFTASWCPASQQFNEVLFQTYQQINSSRKTLEVIVVSKERNEIDYRRYTDRMPCILVPYDPDRVQELFRKYQINEVPQLVLLKKDDGGILTREGKLHIEADGAAVIERWKKMFYGIIV